MLQKQQQIINMPDQFREESIKAVMPETRRPAAVEPITKRLREQISKNTTQSPLEAYRTAVEGMDILDRDSSKSAIAENIGTQVDSRGNKVLSPEQTTLKTKALEYEEIAGVLLDKGYDSPEFAAFKDRAKDSVEGMLQAMPELAAIVPTNLAKKEQFLKEIIKDPRFLAIVRKRYVEVSSQKLPDTVTDVSREYDAAKKVEDDLTKKIVKTKTRVRELTEVVDRFEPGHADDVTLEGLSKTYGQDSAKVRAAELQITRIEESIGRLELLIMQREDVGEPTNELEVKMEAFS